MLVPELLSKIGTGGGRLAGAGATWIGKAVLSAVDTAIERRWEDAIERAGSIPGTSIDKKVSALAKSSAQEMGKVGAVTGAAAAVPALGTAAAVSTGVAEVGWFTLRASDLILTIAALHGHTRSTVEERRAWILSILTFGSGAAEGFRRIAGEVGRDLGQAPGKRIPLSMLRGINSSLGRTVLTRYGKRRGAIALGTALPFGIGAVVGASTNYAAMRTLAKHADKFFTRLPYATVTAEPRSITRAAQQGE